MSAASIHGPRASRAPSLDRTERNNQTFSKIAKIALATFGIIASYAFLPPVGATIFSSLIILTTILSFTAKEQKEDDTDASSSSRPSTSSSSSPSVVFVPSSAFSRPSTPPVIIVRDPWYVRFPRYIWPFSPSSYSGPRRRTSLSPGPVSTPSSSPRRAALPERRPFRRRDTLPDISKRIRVGAGDSTPSSTSIPPIIPSLSTPSSSPRRSKPYDSPASTPSMPAPRSSPISRAHFSPTPFAIASSPSLPPRPTLRLDPTMPGNRVPVGGRS